MPLHGKQWIAGQTETGARGHFQASNPLTREPLALDVSEADANQIDQVTAAEPIDNSVRDRSANTLLRVGRHERPPLGLGQPQVIASGLPAQVGLGLTQRDQFHGVP